MKSENRLRLLLAWAVLLCTEISVLAQGVVQDSALVREVRMEDTLRPVPWNIAVWDGESFRNESSEDRVLSVPIGSARVGVSALGSPAWDFSLGLLGSSIPVGVPYWMNAVREIPQDWNVRKGPLPVVDWVGESAHGRGQEFGVVASASPKYYQHFWIDFRRLQMSGGLLTEDHFRDRLQTAFWGRDSARRWNYSVQVGLQRTVDGEAGGVVDVAQLTEAEFWQPNRDLVTTRWSQAERVGQSGQVRAEWIHVRSRLGVELNWSHNRSGFQGSGLSVDSILYEVLDIRVVRTDGARWSEPALRGFSVIDVLPKVRSSWSAGVRLINAEYWESGVWNRSGQVPRWSPVGSWEFPGRRNRLRADVDLLGQAVEFRYGRQKWLDHGSNPWLELELAQRWTMPWQGSVVSHVRSGVLKVTPWKQLVIRAQVSSSDPMLSVADWSDASATWVARDSWAMLGADLKGRVNLSRNWSVRALAQGRWASSRQLGLAPGFGELGLVYAAKIPNLYPGMRVQFELQGQGWTGGWQRPVWVAEKGLFGYSQTDQRMLSGGLVHAAAMVYLGEAQLGVIAQNANQGWIPNTVFVAQNYPVPPATIRWFLRWRMFE